MASILPPVAIFCFKRVDAFRNLIGSLIECDRSSELRVYIYSDGPQSESDVETIREVRNYARSIAGFQEITIIEHDVNLGLANNIISGVTEILLIHDRIVVLEDDLVVAPNFLNYMASALAFYKDHQQVGGISGFSLDLYNLQSIEKDSYVLGRPSSWGWAIWRDRWQKIDWELRASDCAGYKLRRDFNSYGGPDLSRMLDSYFNGKSNSWAIRWCFHVFRQRQIIIYPKKSLVLNLGFSDPDSTHGKGHNFYVTTLDSTQHSRRYDFESNLELRKILNAEFKWRYSRPFKLITKVKDWFL